ncbi:arabinan endo-1,5-alpha-L-arabinosidase [Sinomicrobium soli]|uniref:arabinan endo-1,5-alpha-L-arabinosidase n=1 Tax=Sinomicrobium sp. N-1-3-6 TaxID=2219864 RepID=UPI000DCBD921|nr:arabinan endo-1,5-alpha-L-arabinosidase [Sinomicrobium sp. N-1-3-6]RAV27486.1 arabinan endo-1,5-alpha-L-arabinosidase [Sinomicrobium sp. N-1-3-6]
MNSFRSDIILLFALCLVYSATSQEITVHDPVMAAEKGRYYLYSTGKGISVSSSPDMKHWNPEPPVFPEAPAWAESVVPGFRNHIWAPDIFRHNGRYYLYYSISSFGKNTSAIGVATNETLRPDAPDYHWKDHGIILRSVPNRDMWNAIDPNVVPGQAGDHWLAFGSFWGGIKLVKLSDDLLSVRQPEEWHTIARRKRSFETADEAPGDAAIEAPFIFYKNGYYYLFVSFDYCCRGKESTYKVVVGRSEQVTGPYRDKAGQLMTSGGGTPVITGDSRWAGAGHNSIYTFGGEDYLVFHGYDSTDQGKPKLRIVKVRWKDGWPGE